MPSRHLALAGKPVTTIRHCALVYGRHAADLLTVSLAEHTGRSSSAAYRTDPAQDSSIPATPKEKVALAEHRD